MIKRLKNNFDAGVEKLKWYSSFISERLKIELSVLRLLQEREKLEKIRAEKLKSIGERIFELRGHSDKEIGQDKIVVESVKEIERIDVEIENLKEKTSEISRVEV